MIDVEEKVVATGKRVKASEKLKRYHTEGPNVNSTAIANMALVLEWILHAFKDRLDMDRLSVSA